MRASRKQRVLLIVGGVALAALVIGVIVYGLARSGSNATDSPAATVTTAATDEPAVTFAPQQAAEAAVPFLRILTEPTADVLAQAQTMVDPGSPAADFLYHEQRVVQAHQQDQSALPAPTSRLDGDTIQVCVDDACDNADVYSNFVVVNGRGLQSFEVNGQPVADLVKAWPEVDAPCGAIYITDLGGTADDNCEAANLVLTMRSAFRDPAGHWTLTFDWTHGSHWAHDLAYQEAEQDGVQQSPIRLDLASTTFDATSWSAVVPAFDRTTAGYATFDVPNGLVDGAAELTIATVSSDPDRTWGCDGTPVCALSTQFDATFTR